MKLRLSAALLFILLTVLPLAADKVLILGTTGGASSKEVVEALALLPAGSTVDVAPTEAAFNALAASGGFSAYRVVIVADPNCGNAPDTPTLAPNWAKDIPGNVIIVGTDQALHASSGGTKLMQRSMAYILSKPQTGAFISLSCYYDYPTSVPAGTPVPLLDNAFASSAGSFTVHGTSVTGCLNAAHLTATHPALAGLTDADIAGWSCSVHEAFDTWPLDFVVLAIAKNSGSSFTAPDGTIGSPYILARGDIAVISNISLGPAVAVNELGKTHTVTATINPPLPGVTVTFKVVTGPNVGLTGTGVTNAAGQATFTYTSTTLGVDFIQAQFTSAGVTQTSNLVRKEWVHTPKSCMRILQSKVLCETDAKGVPTGNYIWQFRVHNTSGTPVSHLFISGLTAPVSAVPDHLIFNPALGSGVSALQQVVIKNAPPGPLTLMLSLHDSRLEHCCSAEVTLDLPECDCAQMVKEATPACYSFPFSSVPPPYKYKFTVQNLSSIVAQKVLVAAVSPIDLVTPVPTSQLQVAAAVNNIPATGPGASAGPLTLNIGGPLAVGGQKVCLNISLNDKDIDDCCSITRCFTLPGCARDLDDHLVPIGGATLAAFGTGFRLGGFGSTGEDGIRIDTGEAARVGVAWEPLDAAAPNGAFIELRASTGLGEPGGKLRVTKVDGRYQIDASVDSAQTYQVEVYRDGVLAGTAHAIHGINIIVVWPVAAAAEVVTLEGEPNHGDSLAFTLDAGTSIAWQLANGTTLTGDRFRITAEQPLAHDELAIGSFELRAANLREIVVTGVSISVDCNDNGIADAEDIADGTSLDQNDNGIPDECDGSANTIVLNTGFDDAGKTVLPGGADDDDWRIVSPAPERPAEVIVNPVSAWPEALSETKWISADSNFGLSEPGVPGHVYQRCFCLSADANAVTLDLALRADDTAVVSLNGQTLATGGSFSAADPLTLRRTGAVGDGLFVTGTNCLRVEVIDSGAGVTGFTLAGTMTATGSGCAPSHHDD